jgi:hypothetical protein
MTQVTVLVDDAVNGRFPPVCALTGTRSDGTVTIGATVTRERQRARRRLLLLLTGPPGWAVALLLARSATRPTPVESPATLGVRIPWTEAAEARVLRLRAERALLWLSFLASAVALAFVMWGPIGHQPGLALDRLAARIIVGTLVALVAGTAAAARVAHHRTRRADIAAHLDESGRWVTLTAVHPAFRDAVREEQRRRRPARSDPVRVAPAAAEPLSRAGPDRSPATPTRSPARPGWRRRIGVPG